MKPPFQITSKIANLISEISRGLGRLESVSFAPPNPNLRRKNRIKTIKSTLAIEGNTFTEEQITAILENKKVVGSQKEIREVQNAIELYDRIDSFRPGKEKDFLKAHSILMQVLVDGAGNYRSKNVGILKGRVVKHLAPKPRMVGELMKKTTELDQDRKRIHPLVLSSVAHYEIEFIHPFEDGNGRIGRFWQALILTKYDPIFKFIPIENLVEKNQLRYYEVLESCDKKGDSTLFIEFMLEVILESLSDFSRDIKGVTASSTDRLMKAKQEFKKREFSRKEYMELFKSISSATASRDLKNGVEQGQLEREGDKNKSRYRFC